MAFLTGYRVLDLTDERGLMAGRMLADLGADVVQVEPEAGSRARRAWPRPPGEKNNSYVWESFAANKRGITADLDTPEGVALIRRLAQSADLLIENEGPRIQRSRGLDTNDLLETCPHLVYVSITPFGRSGPKSDYADSDLVLWAAGGPLDRHREDGRPPVRISIPQAWLHASADAAAGAALALIARQRTGVGQLVDVSVQASLSTATLARVLAHAIDDKSLEERSVGHALPTKPSVDQSGSGSGTESALRKWACSDGVIELHLGIGPAAGGFTNNLIGWMLTEGAPVERFGKIDWRTVTAQIESGEFTENDSAELRAAVAAFLAPKTKAEILDASIRLKLLCVPIFDTTDVRTSVQLADRDFWISVGAGARRRTIPGPFARISADGFSHDRPAPLRGEHTAEVVEEWSRGASAPTTQDLSRTRAETTPELRPLDGLKICDLSWVVAGPLVGRTLADFGATVVRVESSRRVEAARLMPPFVNGDPDPEGSALYATCNAGKFGMTLDLSTEAGRQVVRDLVAWADVVIESFAPGQMAKWGLDYATLKSVNPRLIMLSTSLNGQTGPYSPLAGFGNIGAAISGFQEIVGWPDRPALGPYGPYTDYLGPRFSLLSLLGAVEHRRRTGEGCFIDVSQVEAGAWIQAPQLLDNADNGTVVRRCGNADATHAPHGVFRSAPETDRAEPYVAVAVETDEQWLALTRIMGREDLAADKQLATKSGRLAAADIVNAAVEKWTIGRHALDIESLLQSEGIPAHVSADSRHFCSDPQIEHRGHLIATAHDRSRDLVVEGPRYLLSSTPGRVDRSAPTFGRDNRLVLGEFLHYDDVAIERLENDGILT